MAVGAWKIAGLVGKVAFAGLFIVGGIAHFATPGTYMKIMPPYLPYHRELVLLSGVFEVVLGVMLLIPKTSRLGAWGLILLLIAVFPANVFMYQHAERFDVSPTLLLARLPLQLILILCAYVWARPAAAPRSQN